MILEKFTFSLDIDGLDYWVLNEINLLNASLVHM